MLIKELEITDFRNIESAKLRFSEGLNVFFGNNAQGKTNALEALFLCSASKSFRTAKENNFLGFNKSSGEIKASFFDGKNDCELDIKFSKEGKRQIFFDMMPCFKASDYIGRFLTVIFTPSHLSLVNSAPEQRRKFLDLAICQSRPVMLSAYSEYSRILKQKNALLKSAKESGIIDGDMIEIYNVKLSELCETISRERNTVCGRLSDYASPIYGEMTENREKLSFEYVSSVKNGTKEEYFNLLTENFDNDMNYGISYYGIHRDDINIKINGKSVREFASQGQQRSTVLAMKLAEGDYLESIRNSMPVFLFDDVLSELDVRRREYILEKIKDKQVILTSCNEDYIKSASHRAYYVENGVFTLQ